MMKKVMSDKQKRNLEKVLLKELHKILKGE